MKTSNTARIHTLASILAIGTLLWGMTLPAQAVDSGYGARVKHVSLSDLDLSTVAGQEAARARLHQVARELCSQLEDELDLSHQANFVKCVEAATAQSSSNLDALIRSENATRMAAVDQVKQ